RSYYSQGWRAAMTDRSLADRTAARCRRPDRTAADGLPNSRRPARHAGRWPACPWDCRKAPSTRGARHRYSDSRASRDGSPDTSGLALEDEIPHAMAEPQAAGFELGLRPEIGPGCIAGRHGVFQRGFVAEYIQHLFGIVFPVCRQVHIAAGLEARSKQGHQRRLDQPPLVMPLLGPWIREIDMHAR